MFFPSCHCAKLDSAYVTPFPDRPGLSTHQMQFLIQSDFITQASRECTHQCPWNDALLDGVAETFRDAVLQFCEHPSPQY